jgi:integrase
MRLTDATIAALAPAAKRLTVRDTELTGYVLRISQRSKTFAYEYRPRGAGSVPATTFKVGRWPALKEAAARRIVQGLVVDVARGGDPRREQRERNAKQAGALKHLLAEGGPYERSLQARGLVNWKTALSSLRRELGPLLESVPAALTRAGLVRQVTALQAAGKPGAARDLRKFSHGLVEWCVAQGYAASNPLAGLRLASKTRAEKLARVPVGRALDDAEIIAVWAAADADATPFGPLVQFAVLSAMRRGELASLQWSDVHADRIVLGAAQTKTGARHEVPLTELMRAVIAHVPRTLSPLVFASPNGQRIADWTPRVARLQQAAGVDFRLHDLRRSCRTLMSKLEIPEDIAELAIGHVRSDLIAKYNKDSAWRHRITAFDAVSTHIGDLLGAQDDPGKIVALGR